MESRSYEITSSAGVSIRVTQGHFSTNHSHINYYVDTTTLKASHSESAAAAKQLSAQYVYSTPVDTIVCIEGTEIIGAFLAEELTKAGIRSMNTQKTIYIVPPEYNSTNQLIFRDNIRPMIAGKNVLLLLADVTTGRTSAKCVEGVEYYGGVVRGVCALFSAVDHVSGYPVNAVFTTKDIPGYQAFNKLECPFCKGNVKLDALVNSFGYSKL
ncbi:MAG: phosphoribosyltransferase [Christensenellaceae bacterium]|nr:phosphoribosyltransferase [Christensenellaceae bacterium]